MAPASLVALRNAAGDEAVISLDGAQLLSWRLTQAGEQLYLSPVSAAPGRARRGGVPVCFPQFAARGPLVRHGFARLQRWRLLQADPGAPGIARAAFMLDEAGEATAQWPHRFELVLQLELATDRLAMQLRARNTGSTPLAFSAALHTYLATPELRASRLTGLAGVVLDDAVTGATGAREPLASLAFDGEIDRVYRDAPATLVLQRPGQPPLQISQQGFADTVVWNPGPDKAAALGDMPAGDWTRMLCVEAAQVARPQVLAPGESWQGTQVLVLQTGAGPDNVK